ncbi:hypothetical protein DIPPA_18452 [Diplonema papillatum]|nr:hypothetical protein DIPPA_18452 [Diplonema papillatum]
MSWKGNQVLRIFGNFPPASAVTVFVGDAECPLTNAAGQGFIECKSALDWQPQPDDDADEATLTVTFDGKLASCALGITCNLDILNQDEDGAQWSIYHFDGSSASTNYLGDFAPVNGGDPKALQPPVEEFGTGLSLDENEQGMVMRTGMTRRGANFVHYGFAHVTISAWIKVDNLSACAEAAGTHGLANHHCSVAGKFKFPSAAPTAAEDQYAFGYWLEVTDAAHPSPGGSSSRVDGNFYTAFHVANGPNIIWSSVVMSTRPIVEGKWHYVTGSFLSGRRGDIPQLTACTDNVCLSKGLEYESNDILGYAPDTRMFVGEVGNGDDQVGVITPINGMIDELLIKPYYESAPTIISRFSRRYSTATTAPVVVIELASFIDPTTIAEFEATATNADDTDTYVWEFVSPASLVLSDDMVTGGLSGPTLSLKPNVLTAGAVYRIAVCTSVTRSCSAEVSFIATAPPTIAGLTVACIKECGAVPEAAVSQFMLSTSAFDSGVLGNGGLLYYYYAVLPTGEEVSLSGGVVPDLASVTDIFLPPGAAPNFILSVGVEVKNAVSGLVSRTTTEVEVRPSTDAAAPTDAVDASGLNNVAPLNQLNAISAAVFAAAAVPASSRQGHLLAESDLLPRFLALNAEFLDDSGTLEPAVLSTLFQLLTPLPTEESVVIDCINFVDRLFSTQFVTAHFTWKLERNVVAIINALHETAKTVGASQSTYLQLGALRTQYLHFVVKSVPADSSAYVVRSLLASGESYKGLPPSDVDYPQLTVNNATVAMVGAARKFTIKNAAASQTLIDLQTPGGGNVGFFVAQNVFKSSTSVAGASVALSPNAYTVNLPQSDLEVATDVATISLYEGKNATDVSSIASGTFRVTLLCPQCSDGADRPNIVCYYLDATSSGNSWVSTSTLQLDGTIVCSGGKLGSYAAFKAPGFGTDSPGVTVPVPIPTEEEAAFVIVTVSKPFSQFTRDWFLGSMSLALNTLVTNVRLNLICPSTGGVPDFTRCIDGEDVLSGRAQFLADDDETLVDVSLTGTEGSALLQKYRLELEGSCSVSALGAYGLCPAPGTSVEVLAPGSGGAKTKYVDGTPSPSDDDEWKVLGPVIGVIVVVILVVVVSLFCCASKQKACFAKRPVGVTTEPVSETADDSEKEVVRMVGESDPVAGSEIEEADK